MKAKIIYSGNEAIRLEDSKGTYRIRYKTLKKILWLNKDFDSWENLYTVSVKSAGRRVSRKFIREMFAEAFTGTRCRHTYDCCGCLLSDTYYWNVARIKRNEYRIRQRVCINC